VVGGGVSAWLWSRSNRRLRRRGVLERSAAVAQERQRIAWEIHDSVRQEIAAARLHLDNLKTAARLMPEAVPELAEQTQAMLRHCEEEARNCIWGLRAGLDDDSTLASTLQRWLKVRQPPGGECTVEMRTEGEPLGLNPDQSFQILRIVQETVNNAISHALAGSIVVSLRRSPEGVELLVEDDGRGFEAVERVDREGIHFGLIMLRERAARIRAQIQVRSELNVGTRLRLVLPDAELTPP
jgi:signal transduction histidine kinase